MASKGHINKLNVDLVGINLLTNTPPYALTLFNFKIFNLWL